MKKSISCTEQLWVAIRLRMATGEEYMDMVSVDKDKTMVLEKIKQHNPLLIQWDKDNPVVRVSSCVLTETPGRK